MLSFFCRARSLNKFPSQHSGPKAPSDQRKASTDSAASIELCGNHPANKANHKGQLIWLRSPRANGHQD